MIVKVRRLISQTTKEELNSSPWIHLNKEYLVLALFVTPRYGVSVYIQTEDNDQPGFFLLDGLEVVSQYLPSSWNTYLDPDNVVKLIPEAWNYESFFEEIADGDLKAVELFNQEAEKMYREEGLVCD